MRYDLCQISTIQSLMEEFGLSFRHSYGQNFLTNPSVPVRIAESCSGNPESGILEIGPGIGTMTVELGARYQKVVSVEIDRGLIPLLGKTLEDYPNCSVIQGDFMEQDLPRLVKDEFSGMPVSVCANLPYYITTPILMKLLESRVPFDTITVMVQSEVADRLTAAPGSTDYGAITAVLGYYGIAQRLFSVKPGCFLPPPKVSSAVVRIVLHKEPPVQPKSEELLFRVIRAAFAQRRKTLLNALTAGFPELSKEQIRSAVETCGLIPTVRGECLSIAEFSALSDRLGEFSGS